MFLIVHPSRPHTPRVTRRPTRRPQRRGRAWARPLTAQARPARRPPVPALGTGRGTGRAQPGCVTAAPPAPPARPCPHPPASPGPGLALGAEGRRGAGPCSPHPRHVPRRSRRRPTGTAAPRPLPRAAQARARRRRAGVTQARGSRRCCRDAADARPGAGPGRLCPRRRSRSPWPPSLCPGSGCKATAPRAAGGGVVA